jgi:hypothetical protein
MVATSVFSSQRNGVQWLGFILVDSTGARFPVGRSSGIASRDAGTGDL